MTSLAQIETLECPGYTSPVSGVTYGAGGTHRMVTRRGVRCGTCGTPEPVLRAQAERAALSQRRHGDADYCGHRPSESCDDCCPDCGIAKPAPTLAERIRMSRLAAQDRFDTIGLPRATRLSEVPLPR